MGLERPADHEAVAVPTGPRVRRRLGGQGGGSRRVADRPARVRPPSSGVHPSAGANAERLITHRIQRNGEVLHRDQRLAQVQRRTGEREVRLAEPLVARPDQVHGLLRQLEGVL